MSYNSGSNRARNFKFSDLKLLARLLPELYSTRSNYYYLLQCFCGQCRTPFPVVPVLNHNHNRNQLFIWEKRAAEYDKRKDRGCDSSVPELRPEMHSVDACQLQ